MGGLFLIEFKITRIYSLSNMELTAENVNKVLNDCLYNEGEDTTGHIAASGVRLKIGFHPERLKKHEQDIEQMLNQLSDDFKKEKGGGASFLNACVTVNGDQWGEHSNIDELLVLGLASGKVSYLMPERKDWAMFPGGMPYFVVN